MKKVLFVTWDGPGAPYLEALFLPIFAGLGPFGFAFHVLQFTWAPPEKQNATKRIAASLDVGYTALPVLRRPAAPATAAMIAFGAAAIRHLVRQQGTEILLPRSIVPAAMSLVAGGDARFVYEADGLAADERVDFAGWKPSGATYRVFREIEAQAVRSAELVFTRTDAAREILLDRAGAGTSADKIVVIPNSKDPAVFTPGTPETRSAVRTSWGAPSDAPCLVFAGSIGQQYCLDESLSLYARLLARRATARLILLTPHLELARSAVARSNAPRERILIQTVPPKEVPAQLAAADVGIALRATTFSQRAVSPIKVAEYLLCGLPVVTTRVGNASEHLTAETGCVLERLDGVELDRAANWIDQLAFTARESSRTRARNVGLQSFALDGSVRAYAEALSRLRTSPRRRA